MLIIGLHGRAGSGKSTFCNFLQECVPNIGSLIITVPFAKPLKQFAKMLGWNGEKDEKGRKLLQLLGTECGRECIHPDIWVHKWEKEISILPINSIILVDDVRFPNEAECIHKYNGILIKLTKRQYNDVDQNHASEQILNDNLFNYIIDSSCSIDHFRILVNGFYLSNEERFKNNAI